jgi:hypothetical protein
MWIIQVVSGVLFVTGVLLVFALMWSSPALLLVAVFRRRLGLLAPRLLLASAFAISASYLITRMEWFDVYRHGMPGWRLMAGYAAYTTAVAGLGWLAASLIVPWKRVRA